VSNSAAGPEAKEEIKFQSIRP